MVSRSCWTQGVCSLHFNAAGTGPAIRDVHFTTGLSFYCSLSTSNEGKQSTIVTLGMVVVFKRGKPGDLRIATRLHRVVLAKKIPGDEN